MKHAGSAGLTVDRFGDSKPWEPRTAKEKVHSDDKTRESSE